MDKYEALLDKMKQSGEVPEWVLDEVQSTYEASGLRTDLKDLREKYTKTQAENNDLRTGLLADRFQKLGISISPSILNIPPDLPVTDPDKVQSWAEEMGLIAKQETTPASERAVHDRIAATSNEGIGTNIPSVSDIQNLSEEEFWKVAAIREAAIKAGKTTP